ncbi:MAG: hypothetical protein VB087_10260 [Candidatus Limiplasma sp.]|nr:hypothetical protein [Candidatus Limiplasma sp.]MEA5146318.1 hypothetical protein [Candidatus Limiplasma sp.]
MASEKQTQVIHLLCMVCDRNQRDKAEGAIKEFKTFVNLMTTGKGTANTRILSYLGLGESDKSIILALMPSTAAHEALGALHTRMKLDKPGNGIAFLTRVYQGCYHRLVRYGGNENGGMLMQEQAQSPQAKPYNLIMVVLNRGYSDDVMAAARAAGAKGGTILHARSFGTGMETFFGVEITPEKELLMIVAACDTACDIMQRIADQTGPETEAGALSFSMPVEDVRGLRTPETSVPKAPEGESGSR